MHKLKGFLFAFFLLIHNAPLYSASPPSVPGWTHSGSLTGVLSASSGIVNSSAIAAEIDGDKSNGKEVAVVSSNGTVQVQRSNGTLLWSTRTPNADCGSASDRIYSSPAVGALKGKGIPDLVVGYGGMANRDCDGGVIAYRGSDGAVMWKFSLLEFAKHNKFGAISHAVYSTPALADVDKNGTLEIGFGSLDRNVYLLNSNGRVRWYYNAADTVFSSPAFVNIDTDRDLEMIIGTDISANSALRPPTKDGGFLYAFKTTRPRGSSQKIGFNQKGAYVWRKYFDQTIQSSPIVANVLPRHRGAEIIVGSGCTFPMTNGPKNGAWLKVVSLKDGRLLQTLHAPFCLSSSPAVADLDDDRVLEIVATVNGASEFGGDGVSRVVAWKATSSEPIWSTIPSPGGSQDSRGGSLQSPVIADMDGNGSLEVLVANDGGIAVLNGRDGSPLTCQERNCKSSVFSLQTAGVVKSTPFIEDINSDGILDLIIGSSGNGGQGMIYAWSNFAGRLLSPAGAQASYSKPWPAFRKNAKRNGV